MKNVTLRKNQAGFSLVELMVVVAIIGILASLAIPSIGKYMAKARQSEAKTQLSSLYTSEKAFFAEYNAYHSKFEAIGYSPEGQLRYNVGFGGAVTDATAANGYNGLAGTNMTTLTYCGSGATLTNGCATLVGADGANPPGIAGTLSQSQFIANASAVVYKTGMTDTWTMNQDKFIQNTVNGIQ